jgi:[ribosomal protein S5]-alanine N-acetyltransferase
MINKSNYNKIIKTRSTIIFPITEDEITNNYVSWLNDIEINKFLETRHFEQTKTSVVDYINSLRNMDNCDMFAIISKETNNHIGNLTISDFNTNNNGSMSLGAMIADKISRSAGIGAEVMISFIDFMFSFDTIERISAGAASENFKSCKTLESIGFKREGVIRKVFPLNNGEKCDEIKYGLLKEEWNDKRKKFATFLNMTEILSN